jgi:hypothetical protein
VAPAPHLVGHLGVLPLVECRPERGADEGPYPNIEDEADEGVSLRFSERHRDEVIHRIGGELRVLDEEVCRLLRGDLLEALAGLDGVPIPHGQNARSTVIRAQGWSPARPLLPSLEERTASGADRTRHAKLLIVC